LLAQRGERFRFDKSKCGRKKQTGKPARLLGLVVDRSCVFHGGIEIPLCRFQQIVENVDLREFGHFRSFACKNNAEACLVSSA
jgi:hypothetical protein